MDQRALVARPSRRDFLLGASAVGLAGCRRPEPSSSQIPGRIVGDRADIGHRLRSGGLPEPARTERRSVVIVGGGVAGLSAVWRLRGAGVGDVTLLDLADAAGGTARASSDIPVSTPWGAHYLPVPNPETTLVLRLLRELGLASNDALPRFDERHLVHDPEDRLFHRGKWYPGLYLRAGATDRDLAELERFETLCAVLRAAVGRDGRLFFALPVALGSRDPEVLRLDRLTMAQYLVEQGFTSERLRWHVDYACRDDYGASIDVVSAWAGLQYFAGRRPWQVPETDGSHYFTWPEGNARLVRHLAARVPDLRTGWLALSVERTGHVLAVELATETVVRFECEAVVLAAPNHVVARLTRGERGGFATAAPWLVASVQLRERPPQDEEPAWNNVLTRSTSVGYVECAHQCVERHREAVWAWYEPLPPSDRSWLLDADHSRLASRVLRDLRPAHGDLSPNLTRLDVWRWGHGTVIPTIGLLSDAGRLLSAEPWGRVHVAHTDLSGLPLFEEAQYHGVRAAEAALSDLQVQSHSWL